MKYAVQLITRRHIHCTDPQCSDIIIFLIMPFVESTKGIIRKYNIGSVASDLVIMNHMYQ